MKESFEGKRVLVVGLGESGISVTRLLCNLGSKVKVTDIKSEEELKSDLERLKELNFEKRLGFHELKDFLDTDLIVVSPGVRTDHPYLEEARRNGIEIIGELELASRFVNEPIIAITGTNGKTTVTTLLGNIFRSAFGDVFVGGNIGRPFTDYVLGGRRSKFLILEVSSFQLETIRHFHPQCAVLLNITEDHLDRYETFEEYVRAKYRIFENQTSDDISILNSKLPVIEGIRSKTYLFSLSRDSKASAYFDSYEMIVELEGSKHRYPRSVSPLIGKHNTENLLAVILVCHLFGIEREIVEKNLSEFRGLPHRIQFVREIDGIIFLDDSKATNVGATKMALESIEGKVILICGGKDKGGSYMPILEERERIKAIVAIGEAKERIADELGEKIDVYREPTLEDATIRAFKLAERGDFVLLSPMCSSFDMFRDYRERGEKFKRIVFSL